MELGVLFIFIIVLGFLTFLINRTENLKGVVMSLTDKINTVIESVQSLADRVAALPKADVIQAALDAERAAAVELAAAEDAEDVDQNKTLAAAQAETNALVAEIAEAEAKLDEVKTEVDSIAKEDTAVDEDAVESPGNPELPDPPVVETPESPVPPVEDGPATGVDVDAPLGEQDIEPEVETPEENR